MPITFRPVSQITTHTIAECFHFTAHTKTLQYSHVFTNSINSTCCYSFRFSISCGVGQIEFNWTEIFELCSFLVCSMLSLRKILIAYVCQTICATYWLRAARDVKGKTNDLSPVQKQRNMRSVTHGMILNGRMAQKRHHCVFPMQSVRFISNPFFTYTLFHLLSVQ